MPSWMPRSAGCGAILLAASFARAEDPGRQWHALPIEGGTAALGRAAGLEPGLPAWRVFYEACQRRHGLWGEDLGSGPAAGQDEPAAGEVRVPLPLAPDFWRGLLRAGGAIEEPRLALAILADRRAALLYRGLAGMDEETLSALAAEADALRRIHRRHAGVFAAFASRFAVRDGVVAVPGGEAAEAIWQSLVGESPRAPARFLRKLVERGDGQLAFFYDSLARLDLPRQRLALGLSGDETSSTASDRSAPARALLAVFEAETPWWRTGRGAFARPDADAARLLRELRLTGDGRIAPPATRAFWAGLFDGAELAPEAIRASPPVDVVWLAQRVASGDPRRRALRLEQLWFAQRVFGAAAEAAPALAREALAGLADARTLVLAIERLGSRDPAFVGSAVKRARVQLAFQLSEDQSRAHAGFQGALAVIDRARFRGALDAAAAERLVDSLVEVPLPAAVPWQRGLGGWVEATLLPALAQAVGSDASDPERTVLRSLAGIRVGRAPGGAFDFEGLFYRARPEPAELRRLEAVRRLQQGARLDQALDRCRAPAASDRHGCTGAVGDALVSLVYAAHLGDPDGPALRGEDPARRHVFLPEPWGLPRETTGPGVPWHVEGSLIGLETVLARLSFHRVNQDALPERAPAIDAVQRRELSASAGLANPRELTAADQSALASAVAAGRKRVAALAPGSPDLAAAARDAGLDPWRARALEWLLEHERGSLAGFFSLGELAYLGSPSGGHWDGWGAAAPGLTGLRLRFAPPRPFDDSAGRQPEIALAETFVDLGVRVALHLAERGLPASLAPALVPALLPDLFLEARPIAPDDRLGLDAWPRELRPERLDDALATLVGRGPLQPAEGPESTR